MIAEIAALRWRVHFLRQWRAMLVESGADLGDESVPHPSDDQKGVQQGLSYIMF